MAVPILIADPTSETPMLTPSTRMKRWPIVTVASDKGGCGKTTIAYEMASVLGAVLVDLDWNQGGATGKWGHDPDTKPRSQLFYGLVACESVSIIKTPPSPPRMLRGTNRPGIIPMDRRIGAITDLDPVKFREMLLAWTEKWQRPIVLDTHPGLGCTTKAAISAADLVITPLIYSATDLEALKDFLQGLKGFPIVVVPNRDTHVNRNWKLVRIVADELRSRGTKIAPPISNHQWLTMRTGRSAITLVLNPPMKMAQIAEEFKAVGDFVLTRLDREMRVGV